MNSAHAAAALSVLLLTACNQDVVGEDIAGSPTPSAESFRGDWVPVDQSASGFTLYVDRGSIVSISKTRKRADLGYADQAGRTVVRVVMHCDEKMVDRATDGIGHVETEMPDLVGDLPREKPHLAARDYVCFGMRSEPEQSANAIGELPEHAD